MTIDVRGFGPIDTARSTALAASAPFRSAATWAVSPIAGTWNGAVHYDDLEAENERLRLRVAELEGELERLPDVEADYEELLAATGFDVPSGVAQVTARVISDRQTGIERIVEINRGSGDGLVSGMPVVVGEGLIGRVEDVFADHRSTIALITDTRVPVGLNGVESGQAAVANGDGSSDLLDLELDPRALDEIVEGERFETSGFSERFPPDIPVGSLVIDGGTARLRPFADFDKLGFVTVLLVVPAS